MLVIFLLYISLQSSEIFAQDNNENKESTHLSNGEIMITSATIIGFSGFGSILALRFQGAKISNQVICTLIIYGALLTEILLHLLVILSAHDNNLLISTYDTIMFVTMFLVSVIVVCFGLITLFQQDFNKEQANIAHIAETSIKSQLEKAGVYYKSPIKSYSNENNSI